MSRQAGPKGPEAHGWQLRGPWAATPHLKSRADTTHRAVLGNTHASATCHTNQHCACGPDRLLSLKKSNLFVLEKKTLGLGRVTH